jgi:DNA segregation ATPase FtsK/SpoIIIE, S-DNA-T family
MPSPELKKIQSTLNQILKDLKGIKKSCGKGTEDFQWPPNGDELFEEAKKIALKNGKISTAQIQRRLRVGYARAARMLDLLEEKRIIEPTTGNPLRKVLIRKYKK